MDVTARVIESGLLCIINNGTEIKKKDVNLSDHQNSAINIVADTSSPVITGVDGKPISARGYRYCFNCFLLNVQCPSKINQWN